MENQVIYKKGYVQNRMKIIKKELSKIELPNNRTQRKVYNNASYVIWVFLAV